MSADETHPSLGTISAHTSLERLYGVAMRENREAQAENTKLRAEVERLRYERAMFRRRIAECLPWVGRVPYPNTDHFNEMIACRDLAKDTLDEVPE